MIDTACCTKRWFSLISKVDVNALSGPNSGSWSDPSGPGEASFDPQQPSSPIPISGSSDRGESFGFQDLEPYRDDHRLLHASPRAGPGSSAHRDGSGARHP